MINSAYIFITLLIIPGFVFGLAGNSVIKKSNEPTCDEVRQRWGNNVQPIVSYWTIKRVKGNHVYLDFGPDAHFLCLNYKESVFAVSEKGELVPLVFKEVISPKDQYDDPKGKHCTCGSKGYVGLYCHGFIDDAESLQPDIAKRTCRFEGGYSFDSKKYKLKPYHVAVHVPANAKAYFELPNKDIKVYTGTPEAKEIIDRKLYPPSEMLKYKRTGSYEILQPSTQCQKKDKCTTFKLFSYLKDGQVDKEEMSEMSFGGMKDGPVSKIGPFYLFDSTLISDNRLICGLGGWGDKVLYQGKLVIGNNSYYVFYHGIGDMRVYNKKHALIDPSLNGGAGSDVPDLISFDSVCFTGKWDPF